MADIPAWKVAATLLRTISFANSSDRTIANDGANAIEQLFYDLSGAKNRIATLESGIASRNVDIETRDNAIATLKIIKSEKDQEIERLNKLVEKLQKQRRKTS